MLFLATHNGQAVSQTLPNIRQYSTFPFRVVCKSANPDHVAPGTTLTIVGYKYGKYVTAEGLTIIGKDAVWIPAVA